MKSVSKRFTEESIEVLDQYLEQVATELQSTDLSGMEIKDSIDELKTHIYSFCELKTKNDEIITTDLIEAAIRKLGEPQSIANTLTSELNFRNKFETMESDPSSNQVTKEPKIVENIYITANHLSIFYQLTSWLLTFLTLGTILVDLDFLQIFLIFYIIHIVTLYYILNLPQYISNKFLKENINVNTHTVITPMITSGWVFVISILTYPSQFDFAIIAIILTIWLRVLTSEAGKDFIKSMDESLSNM